ncbi:unnamed protein product [Vitrella brassicaformis CCMP3155]|uniref:peptidylprolyl isomerase n=1 Tax=Vitrella brassicaformis (strain CCMP3155) TaxID=1169540 RepID=A0A0G4ED53_VITBC|nr:unnamed protein product [Vitrella brassicaformis CCMP3155]|eukprot:CEL93612.1 unnamed protein product [Vitrella brassicaformis CCMP3155]
MAEALLGGVLLSGLGIRGAAFADGEDWKETDSGLAYSVLKSGEGPKVEAGDLVVIRFRGQYKNIVIDDLFRTSEPYYARAAGGKLVAGLEEALLMMRVGDRWKLKVPGALAFGQQGRSPAPGRPRIPPNAPIEYEMLVVDIPGKGDPLDLYFGDTDQPDSDFL